MFGLLKSKISDFLSGITKRGEEKGKEAPLPQAQPPQPRQEDELPKAVEKPKAALDIQPQKQEETQVRATQAQKPVFQEEGIKQEMPPQEKRHVPQPQQKPKVQQAQKTQQISQLQQAAKEPARTTAVKQQIQTEQMPVTVVKQPGQAKLAQKAAKGPVAPTAKEPAQIKQAEQTRTAQPAIVAPAPVAKDEPDLATHKIEVAPAVSLASPASHKPAIPQNPFSTTAQPDLASQARLEDLKRLEKKAVSGQESRVVKPKVGIMSQVAAIFSSNIVIKENDVADLLDTLELSLLEGDVSYEVSQDIVAMLKKRLVGASVPKSRFAPAIKSTIRDVLVEVMTSEKGYDLIAQALGGKKPFKILFVGPNGAGKTTTMAKLAQAFAQKGMTCVFAAADTFRAAAIEQLEVHAERLGVQVIKSQYGSDPASVAFDAIKFAQSHSIDVVLIDSSGRQDTNANLLAELKKIVRIAAPDAKIYIGESIAGNAIAQQVSAFNEAIGIDAVILTKLDCDPKGGSALSVSKATGVPIIYVGVGQAYSDLQPFSPQKIADEIVAA